VKITEYEPGCEKESAMEMRSEFVSPLLPHPREDCSAQAQVSIAPGANWFIPTGRRLLPTPLTGSRMSDELTVELGSPISERDHFRGPPSAPVTLVEYGDFECLHCGRAYPVVREIRESLGDRLRLVFRNFPLATIHPHAQNAAEAAEAAGSQRLFWQMHDALFEHQTQLSDRHLRLYATQSGLDMDRFNREMAAHAWAPAVREHFLCGVRSGINRTPTLFVNGLRYLGLIDVLSLRRAIEDAA
jgi:protein-disulfide isomerase